MATTLSSGSGRAPPVADGGRPPHLSSTLLASPEQMPRPLENRGGDWFFKLQTMQPSLPLWFQRLAPERRRRLELAVAAATEARLDTHAEQALHLVAVLSPRMSFDQAVERYVQMMGLGGDDAQVVQTRALVVLSESGAAESLAMDRRPTRLSWKYATPLGAVRFVRRHLRRNAEEDLWMELSAARAEEALVRTHVKHALHFITILEDQCPPTRAVSLYLEQLEVPSARARAVYQRTLARVAATELPHLVFKSDASAGSG